MAISNILIHTHSVGGRREDERVIVEIENNDCLYNTDSFIESISARNIEIKCFKFLIIDGSISDEAGSIEREGIVNITTSNGKSEDSESAINRVYFCAVYIKYPCTQALVFTDCQCPHG